MSSLVQTPPLHRTRSLTNGLGLQKQALGGGLKGQVTESAGVRADGATHDLVNNVLYKKARVYMQCRPKRVMFSVNRHLYQSGKLIDDVKRLRNDNFEGVVAPASLIWGERFDQDVLQYSKTLNEDNFWGFVHSVAWQKFSSIRVTEGALLESLLYAYYSLVQKGKLLSYVTDVYQSNPRSGKEHKGETETVKITFTYYAPSLRLLSDAIYRSSGSRVSIETLADHNGSSGSSDVMLDLGWSTHYCRSPASIAQLTRATPVNPPNSPTPSTSPTQALLKQRKARSLAASRRGDTPQYPASYYSLPLVLRNRFTLGLKQNGDHGMAIQGKPLQCHRGDDDQYRPCSEVYFTREGAKASGYKSSLQAVRSSLGTRSPSNRLPSISPSPKKDACPLLGGRHGDSPSPLHSCMASPTTLHRKDHSNKPRPDHDSPSTNRPDSKQLTFSPNLEYIAVVQRVTPGPFTPKPVKSATFDTKKLVRNWSLEKIRKVRGRRGKKKEPTPKDILNKLKKQETDKDYVLEKFLSDQPSSSQSLLTESAASCPLHTVEHTGCQRCLQQLALTPSPLPIITKHSEVRKLRFAPAEPVAENTRTESPVITVGFADTVADFRHGCYASTEEFVIRKEQVTASKSFLTVTSLTINKIPNGGFMKWQYKTDESELEK